MRCLACNRVLNDHEATRKAVESETYIDLCNKCFDASDFTGVEVMVRSDLVRDDDVDQESGYIGDAEGDVYYDDHEG